MVLLIDAADFIIIEGGAPRFDVSDQATLHLEDSAPLAIGTAGTSDGSCTGSVTFPNRLDGPQNGHGP
jgi:hypothetical protein